MDTNMDIARFEIHINALLLQHKASCPDCREMYQTKDTYSWLAEKSGKTRSQAKSAAYWIAYGHSNSAILCAREILKRLEEV
jgi:hypothetical protein